MTKEEKNLKLLDNIDWKYITDQDIENIIKKILAPG